MATSESANIVCDVCVCDKTNGRTTQVKLLYVLPATGTHAIVLMSCCFPACVSAVIMFYGLLIIIINLSNRTQLRIKLLLHHKNDLYLYWKTRSTNYTFYKSNQQM